MQSKGAPPAIPGQEREQITKVFAESLGARLGRPAAEIRAEGLAAGDFKSNESIVLTLCDGSTMSLRHAFAVVEPKLGLLGVFTEHCGYFCFRTVDVQLDEVRDGIIVRRQSW